MELREKLAGFGWRISDPGYLFLTENGTTTSVNFVLAKALNMDIRDFGDTVLSSLLKQTRTDKIILQIQKIRNVASPKSKEDSQVAPRMLKLMVTDGHTTCPAIEVSNLPFLSRSDTAPGSKLLLNGAKVTSGCILLQPKCCELLGGRVPTLYEKWEVTKNISQNIRSAGSDGPPPWVNFGEKIITSISNEPFKALVDKTPKENTNDFDIHRQDAISTAATGAVRKVFGGGIKQPTTLNNSKQFNSHDFNRPRNTRGFKSKVDSGEKTEKPQKPQEKVSLFDFLEDKLPAKQSDDKHVPVPNRNSEKYTNSDQSHYYTNNHVPKYAGNKPLDLKQNKNTYVHKSPFTSNVPSFTSVPNQTNNRRDDRLINELSKDMSKMSYGNSNSFATRSIKQHLNIYQKEVPEKSTTDNIAYNWKIGDLCMAKYWEDGRYYNAVITNLTQNTCVVTFNVYGNVEEVLKADCLPVDVDNHSVKNTGNTSFRRDYKDSREYHNNRRPFTNKPFNSGNYYNKS